MTAKRRPNILFISTDQQRADYLGCMGHPLVKTPNMDRIGGEGLVCENAYVPNPLCMPTRVSVITGRWPEIVAMSPTAASSDFASLTASPRPMLRLILPRRGACMTLV